MNLFHEKYRNALASLLLVFSGIWPHVKLLLLLAGLQQDVSPRMHTTFKWLCTMGKWSFLDALVVALIVVVFRVDIDGSSVLGEKVYSGWLAAAAGEGLYMFTLAICISQMLGKIIVLKYENNSGIQRSMQCWTLATELTAVPRFCVALSILLIIITMITAMMSPCYAVESEVDLKYYVPLYHRQLQNQTHSIISGWSAAWEPNQIGTSNQALTILACILVTVMPVCETLLLLVLCFVHMSNTSHERMALILQAVSDWACLDVFLVVLLVAKAQTPILANKLNKNFHVTMELRAGMYTLVAAAMGLLVVRTYVQCLHQSTMRKRSRFMAVSDTPSSNRITFETELQEQRCGEDIVELAAGEKEQPLLEEGD